MVVRPLLLAVGFYLLEASSALAQSGATFAPDTGRVGGKTFIYVEQMPVFPGGQQGLYQTIGQTIFYPTEALRQGLEGTVYVGFVVGPSGWVQDVKVSRGVHPLLDAEAVRAVGLLPVFTPGRQVGRPVPVAFTLPIGFRLPPNVKEILAERAKADSTGTR